MARILRYRDKAGREVSAEVSDEVAEHFRRAAREKRRAEVLALAPRIDPEPTDAMVKERMRETGESYDLASNVLYTEWEERAQKRERELAVDRPVELSDEHDADIRMRAEQTGEDYDAAARALAVELEGGVA